MKRILLILLLLISAKASWSTHIVGGEIYYRNLGNNQYEVTVLVYRDCSAANTNELGFDSPGYLGVFQNGALIQNISIDPLSVRIIPIVLVNPCLGLPPGICVEEGKYITTISLPASPDDYGLVYQRCCRSPAIQNLQDVSNYGLSLFTTIPGSAKTSKINSSPYFKNLMPLAFCLGDAVSFDHSAIDLDGDSLVYGLVAPFNGGDPANPQPIPPVAPPYAKVLWSAGYSDNYPIDSDPAININSSSGLLTLTTNKVGVYVFGVYVQEWRNGVLLSTNIRDFQFNVVNCSQNVAAALDTQRVFCNGAQYNFTNTSENGTYYKWYFGSLTNPLDSSDLKDPSYTFPNFGNYLVYLIVNPGYTCADTAVQSYQIREKLEVAIDSQQVQCLTTNSFDLRISGNFKPTANFTWTFPSGTTVVQDRDSIQNGVKFDRFGWLVYQVEIDNNNCVSTLVDSVEVESPFIFADFETQKDFCVGTSYDFRNLSSGTNYYFWDFGFSASTELDPAIQFPDTGVYLIKLIAGGTEECADTTAQLIDLKPNYSVELLSPDTSCFDFNNIMAAVLGTDLPRGFTTLWTAQNESSVIQSGTDSLHSFVFSSPGKKIIHAIVSAYGCTRSAEDSVVLVTNPLPEFSVSNVSGCVPLRVDFSLNNTYPVKLTYDWKFDELVHSYDSVTSYIYPVAGLYFPEVKVVSQHGCLDTASFVLPFGVTVYPDPPLGFDVDRVEIHIDDPVINIFSSLTDNSRSHFEIVNQYQTTDSAFTYKFPEVDRYRVLQVNESQYGCIDTLQKLVTVGGYLAFVPSAFSPDGDGFNDRFLPIVSNSLRYEFRIFDRWGLELFYSSRRGESWSGESNGRQCPIGVYNYILELVDFDSVVRSFRGSVTLLR